MSDAQHTPGPWKWVPSPAWGYSALWNEETRQEVLVPGGRNEADSPETWMGEEMSEADKALIASAPGLAAELAHASGALCDANETILALLAALKEAERFLDYFANGRTMFVGGGMPLDALAQVRAAIAKAEGSNPRPASAEGERT